jgi:hypothetical protein
MHQAIRQLISIIHSTKQLYFIKAKSSKQYYI